MDNKDAGLNQFTVRDQITISKSRDEVWQKLNDPTILAQCIRGCARVEKPTDTQFDAVIEASIGQFRREFKVKLSVQNAMAPERYTLVSGMNAGLIGRAEGTANVNLAEVDGAEDADKAQTVLDYAATIELKGLLGKATSLVAPLAKNRVREFFDRFEACVNR